MFLIVHALIPSLYFVALSRAAQQHVLKDSNVSPFTAKFAQLADETLKLFHVPGVSIAVVDGDNVWAEGYGMATFPSTPVMPSTLFFCASTTKAFTAAALSLLVDNSSSYQDIQWSTPISELIHDDFVLENDYATTHTTIEDALSHRSGLPSHDISYGTKKTLKDTVKNLEYLKLTAEPRTKFQYCNSMYIVASHVVESLTGIWLGDFLRERIWEPLGMNSTYFSLPAAESRSEVPAQGYFYNKTTLSYIPVGPTDLSIISGAGSIVSNVLDYSKWLRAFLSESHPLSKAGYKALLAPRSFSNDQTIPPFTGPQSYALGWNTCVYQGYQLYFHDGGMEGFGSKVIFFPRLSYGLVGLGNTGETSNAAEERLLWELIDEKIGVPLEERYDWNKRNLDDFQRAEDALQDATKTFYPSIPSPPLPASLPFPNYAGTYWNPGYQNLTISSVEGDLFANRSDATWRIRLDFEHVSGDYFMVRKDSLTAPGVWRSAMPAEFRVGPDGVARELGILLEWGMGDEKIWFERI